MHVHPLDYCKSLLQKLSKLSHCKYYVNNCYKTLCLRKNHQEEPVRGQNRCKHHRSDGIFDSSLAECLDMEINHTLFFLINLIWYMGYLIVPATYICICDFYLSTKKTKVLLISWCVPDGTQAMFCPEPSLLFFGGQTARGCPW